MEKVNTSSDEMRPEYRREDFDKLVRGKYAKRIKESSNVVVLDPDVVEAFPNAKAVNEALHRLIEIAKATVQLPPQQ